MDAEVGAMGAVESNAELVTVYEELFITPADNVKRPSETTLNVTACDAFAVVDEQVAETCL